MRTEIELFLNGHSLSVGGGDAMLTLAEWLRRRQRLAGTKIVCAEGDCGSCAVLVGRRDHDAGGVRYASVASCIQLMFQLDGTHVVTIEGLRVGGQLNPIQDAMVRCHGTQCGFCTPGFVIALHDLMHDGRPCDDHAVRRQLVGNLCRCTGYDSIVKAALSTDRAALRRLSEQYPISLPPPSSLQIDVDGKTIFKPATLDEALAFRRDNPSAVVVAGATDLGVLVNKKRASLGVVLCVTDVAEMRDIFRDADLLGIGAAEPLTTLEHATADTIPELSKFLAYFGSPLIKNAGTLGGNLVTGSPIGDSLPAMTVLDATLELHSADRGVRLVPIGEFYTGYRQTVLAADELLVAVRLVKPALGQRLKLFKVSRRKDLDISTFSAAFLWTARDGVIEEITIAFGGVGPTVLRMRKTEEALRGAPIDEAIFERAAEIAEDEVTPITDVRGSDTHRRLLAANIVRKLWHECFAPTNGVHA